MAKSSTKLGRILLSSGRISEREGEEAAGYALDDDDEGKLEGGDIGEDDDEEDLDEEEE